MALNYNYLPLTTLREQASARNLLQLALSIPSLNVAKVSKEQCSLSQPQSINGQSTIEHYQLTINTLADSLSALRPCPLLFLSMSLLGGRFFVSNHRLTIAIFDDKHVKTRVNRRVVRSISEASGHSFSAV